MNEKVKEKLIEQLKQYNVELTPEVEQWSDQLKAQGFGISFEQLVMVCRFAAWNKNADK